MEWVRFKKDLSDDDGNIKFKANPKKYTKKTRYAVQYGDGEFIYISNIPNDEECAGVTRFKTKDQEQLFDIVEEY